MLMHTIGVVVNSFVDKQAETAKRCGTSVAALVTTNYQGMRCKCVSSCLCVVSNRRNPAFARLAALVSANKQVRRSILGVQFASPSRTVLGKAKARTTGSGVFGGCHGLS